MHTLLEVEKEMKKGRNRLIEMFAIPRNRRAAQASWIVMVNFPQMTNLTAVHATILWGKCHLLLFFCYLSKRWVFSNLSSAGEYGLRNH